jgi:hypothetical protein
MSHSGRKPKPNATRRAPEPAAPVGPDTTEDPKVNSADHASHMARIEERLKQGLPVTQEDWDRAAGLFADDDVEEMVPPDPEPDEPATPKRPLPVGIGQLIRDAFRDLEEEEHDRKK